MACKDYFSNHAQIYAKARPGYPDALFQWLAGQCRQQRLTWDCATGNGQAARSLTGYFQQVFASDASVQQLAAAQAHERIGYCVAAAESVPLPAESVDLITVAQALHWFDIDRFFEECERVLASNGLLAVWSYDLCAVDESVDAATRYLYTDLLGDYWPAERSLVEQHYRGQAFPFTALETPRFRMRSYWQREQYAAYLQSWSASQRYLRDQRTDPVARIAADLGAAWPDGVEKAVEWPLTLIVCRKQAILPDPAGPS